ncbi:MAG: hypothetical protein JWL77_1432 [Chthonomonadaceae bacterium]|nr:hypothetical protein [Chthonomonadaceae bacterium]
MGLQAGAKNFLSINTNYKILVQTIRSVSMGREPNAMMHRTIRVILSAPHTNEGGDRPSFVWGRQGPFSRCRKTSCKLLRGFACQGST